MTSGAISYRHTYLTKAGYWLLDINKSKHSNNSSNCEGYAIQYSNKEIDVRGKGKVKIHEDINHNTPIAEKIMVRYLGSLEHPMAKALMSSVKNGDSVILEVSPSYYSTWDYSKR
jgi:hypothetical protein